MVLNRELGVVMLSFQMEVVMKCPSTLLNKIA